jgi:hypothetical protein
MRRVKSIAKVVVAIGAILGAHFALPETINIVVEALVAGAAVLARSPLE